MSSASGLISEDEFREKLAEAERLLKEVKSTLDLLFRRCNNASRFLPPGFSEAMVTSLNGINSVVNKFFEEMAKIFVNPGWPPGLFNVGTDWTQKIGGPVSGLSGQLGPDQMKLDRYWSGRAADSYAAVVPAQQKAVDAIKSLTDSVDSNLSKVAYGIIAFWVAILLAIASYLVEISAEAAAAATGLGAPPAAAAAGVSSAKVLALIVGAVTAFGAFLATIVDGMTSLRQVLENNGAYPAGAWPRATASEFQDGSLSDGDTTDWRYKSVD